MRTVWGMIWKWIVAASVFASILGIILVFLANKTAVIIALAFTCVILLVALLVVIRTLNQYLETTHDEDYEKIASFAEFRTDNGVNSTYDTYRLIQCKRLMLTSIEYPFKWTGSKFPHISSNCQKIINPSPSSMNEWDKVTLEFDRPLLYNQSSVIHFHTDNDDSDNVAKPYVSLRVTSPIAFIQFRSIITCYPKGYNVPAKFERKKISSNFDTQWENLASIPFDEKSHSYLCQLPNPEPEYTYRLRWEKDYQ